MDLLLQSHQHTSIPERIFLTPWEAGSTSHFVHSLPLRIEPVTCQVTNNGSQEIYLCVRTCEHVRVTLSWLP